MKTTRLRSLILLIGFAISSVGLADEQTAESESSAGLNLVERGRYITLIAGCNDCHTPGYAMKSGNVPEEQWLTGDSFGWRGSWGTTYGTNLRLFIDDLTEKQWVQTARTLRRRPPMPWFNLNAMSADDLQAVYHFIRSLGDPGLPAPAALPPGEEPETEYAMWIEGTQQSAQ